MRSQLPLKSPRNRTLSSLLMSQFQQIHQLYHFTNGPPTTDFTRLGCRFAAFLCFIAPPLRFPTLLPVVLVVTFLPVTRSLFALAICRHPSTPSVHIFSTRCFPVFTKLFHSHFSLATSFLTFSCLDVLALITQIIVLHVNN